MRQFISPQISNIFYFISLYFTCTWGTCNRPLSTIALEARQIIDVDLYLSWMRWVYPSFVAKNFVVFYPIIILQGYKISVQSAIFVLITVGLQYIPTSTKNTLHREDFKVLFSILSHFYRSFCIKLLPLQVGSTWVIICTFLWDSSRQVNQDEPLLLSSLSLKFSCC